MALSETSFRRLLQRVELGRMAFELGLYLEAAAIWEQAWRESSGASRQLIQGLIQAAGAYRKRQLGQPLGMAKLLTLAQERLAPLPEGLAGLRLEAFRAGLERSRKEAVVWSTGGLRPAPAPELARTG